MLVAMKEREGMSRIYSPVLPVAKNGKLVSILPPFPGIIIEASLRHGHSTEIAAKWVAGLHGRDGKVQTAAHLRPLVELQGKQR